MRSTSEEDDPATSEEPGDGMVTAIRGSALLVTGRILNIGLSLAIQVLIVRALTKAEFGAFGYALALASTGSLLVALGSTKAVPRFLAIHDENKDGRRFVGLVIFEILMIATLGVALVVATALLDGPIRRWLIDDPLTVSLLAVMMVTAPQKALDRVAEAVAAVLGQSRTIFFRKYLLDPGSRLAVVLALVILGAGAEFLAYGYVAAGMIGVIIYLRLVVDAIRKRNYHRYLRRGEFTLPGRDLFMFSFPMLSYDMAYIAINTLGVILLGKLHDSTEVAVFRAVYPLARFNQIIAWTSAVLYTPLAGRLVAKNDKAGLRDAYWRAASWLAVLTLPIFMLTAAFATPVATTVLGANYADSGPVLTVLATGFFLNTALGYNVVTLNTWGSLRFTVVVNIIGMIVFTAAALLVIPRYGALGAAIASSATLIALNIGFQIGIARIGLGFFDRKQLRIYGPVLIGAATAMTIGQLVDVSFIGAIVISGAIGLAVLLVVRRSLAVMEIFPELGKIPFVNRIFR